MKQRGTAGEATDDNIIQRIRIACSITKATNTQSEYITIIALPQQHGDLDAPHCYVILTVPVLLFISYMYVPFSFLPYFILFLQGC